jgi:hypothetical protein
MNDHPKFPTSSFIDSPKRKRQDLTPLSAIPSAFRPSSPVAGPSSYHRQPQTIPVKRIKLQQALPSPAESGTASNVTPLTSRVEQWNSPQKSPNFKINALHPPIPLGRQAKEPIRLPLGTIAPVHTTLQACDTAARGHGIPLESIEQESDEDENTKPCHPRMTE